MPLSAGTWSASGRIAVVVSAVVIAAAAIGADPADAKARRKRAQSSYKPPYAAIVVDANSGQVLHAANPDALRHPASLTKIMTLYLLFEQMEAGKLKPDSRLEVSEYASSQAPSKLGLKPGQSIAVEDAIKALVTKSANDAAVVVAEAIAGDEDAFAERMTRKARALGMNKTVYANASGLPDVEQVTTARDQAVLGRAIQDRFPRHYRYFATPSFQYRGVAMRNHNKLLGSVTGVDGIKTGYTNASGFNLVSSMRRGNRHIVAVVMGGASGSARDARMRSLLSEHIQTASARRSAPKLAEAPSTPNEKRAEAPASNAPKPKPAARSPSSSPQPAERDDAVTATSSVAAPGSNEPIRPVTVRTITVRAGGVASAAVAPVTIAVPMATAAPASLAKSSPDTPEETTASPQTPSVATQAYALASAQSKPAQPPDARPGVRGISPAQANAAQTDEKRTAEKLAHGAAPAPEAGSAPARPSRSGWVIQVGAFPDEGQAKERLKAARNAAKSLLSKADPFTEQVAKGTSKLYRARFAGFDQDSAQAACKQLKRNDIVCVALKQ